MNALLVCLAIPVGSVLVLQLGCVIGWATSNRPCGDPWNWRVLAGPWAYLKWLNSHLPCGR